MTNFDVKRFGEIKQQARRACNDAMRCHASAVGNAKETLARHSDSFNQMVERAVDQAGQDFDMIVFQQGADLGWLVANEKEIEELQRTYQSVKGVKHSNLVGDDNIGEFSRKQLALAVAVSETKKFCREINTATETLNASFS